MNYETGVLADSGEPIVVDPDAVEDAELRKRSRRRTIVIAALVVLGLAIGAYFLFSGGNTATPAGGEDDQLPTVTVIEPGRETVAGEISATGTLAARRSTQVGVVGEGGRVVAVNVDAGDWVRQGQVLAVIDRSVQSQQAQSAAASIQVAQADAKLAQSNLDRALKLVERGFVSDADVDRLTAQRDAAAAQVRVAQAQLRELQARNARLNILAPVSGLVLERNVEPGQTVSASNSSVFSIAKGGEMELLARLGEGDLAQISAGTVAEVVPVGSSQSFTGRVWQVSPIIDPQDRQGTARIALSYAAGLRPGGFASATIKSGTTVAPVLPESAIMSDEKGDYVYVIDGENKVVRQPVKQGAVTANGIVVAAGLTGTERVILRAGGFVNPGEAVNPVMAKD